MAEIAGRVLAARSYPDRVVIAVAGEGRRDTTEEGRPRLVLSVKFIELVDP